MMLPQLPAVMQHVWHFAVGVSGRKMGNFYEDVIRVTTRILIPFSFVIGLLLVSQGVPQTLQANETIQTIEGKMQDLHLDR